MFLQMLPMPTFFRTRNDRSEWAWASTVHIPRFFSRFIGFGMASTTNFTYDCVIWSNTARPNDCPHAINISPFIRRVMKSNRNPILTITHPLSNAEARDHWSSIGTVWLKAAQQPDVFIAWWQRWRIDPWKSDRFLLPPADAVSEITTYVPLDGRHKATTNM